MFSQSIEEFNIQQPTNVCQPHPSFLDALCFSLCSSRFVIPPMLNLFPRSRITSSFLKSQEPVTELSDEFDRLPAEILSGPGSFLRRRARISPIQRAQPTTGYQSSSFPVTAFPLLTSTHLEATFLVPSNPSNLERGAYSTVHFSHSLTLHFSA